jgi:hypothetical protein
MRIKVFPGKCRDPRTDREQVSAFWTPFTAKGRALPAVLF